MQIPAPNPLPFGLSELKLFEIGRPVTFSQLSPCGQFLFAADYEATLHRWQIDGDEHLTVRGHHGGWIAGMAFHPDGQRMFTADTWGAIAAWNYADESPEPLWKIADCHPTWMRGLAISPDGSTLATCGVDRFVRLWSTVDGKALSELPRHGEELFCVAFHPDGKSLVGGDLKGNIVQWDLATMTVSRTLDAKRMYARPVVNGYTEINDVGGVRLLSFSPDGTTLIAGGCEPVTSGFFTAKPLVLLFDWATGERRHSLQPPDAKPEDGSVQHVALHPAGHVIATTSGQAGNGSLWCWRPGEDKPFFLTKEFPHLRSASLHPDGRRLVVSQNVVGKGVNAGNGRGVDKAEDYKGLVSRLRVFDTAGGKGKGKASGKT